MPEVERSELGREVLGNDNCVVVSDASDARAKLVRMHRTLPEVLSSRRFGLGPGFLGVGCQGVSSRFGNLVATVRGGCGVNRFVEVSQPLPGRARQHEVSWVVAADDIRVGREPDELCCQRRFGATGYDSPAEVGRANTENEVRTGKHLVLLIEASQVLGMMGGEVVVSLSLVCDRYAELFRKLQ